MSGKFSSTATSLPSNTLKDQDYIREIVQSEVFLIFQDIKGELETKIKSIDRNILELRSDVQRLKTQHGLQELAELSEKMERIETEMQILKYHQQNTIKISRTKSLDKDRKPIFKRDDSVYDFSSVILGLEETDKDSKNQKPFIQKRQNIAKPPLPKSQPHLNQTKSASVLPSSQKRIFARNPVLDSSSSIHRWLHENNNNRQFSCFSSVIRQEDIEESIFI